VAQQRTGNFQITYTREGKGRERETSETPREFHVP